MPKHLLDDIEEDCVIGYLALALTWLVVSTTFSVLVGKCIAAGLTSGAARPVRGAAARDAAAPPAAGGPVEEDVLPVLGEAVVPPQRRPSVPDRGGQHLSDALRT